MKKNKKKKSHKKFKDDKFVITFEHMKPRFGVIFTKVVSNKNLKKHRIKHKNKVDD